MSFGARISGELGNVQVDETYRNLLLIGQGNYTGGVSAGGVSVAFPFQSSCVPVLAVRPITDGTYLGTLAVTRSGALIEATGPFEWAAYGLDSPINTTGSTSFGVQVFTAEGALAFDSRFETCRIQYIIQEQLPWPARRNDFSDSPTTSWPAYPYTWSFPGWGQRPWISLNNLSLQGNEEGQVMYYTTNGTSQIIARPGFPSGSTAMPSWALNGPDGYRETQADTPPFGQIRIPLLRR